MHLPDYKEARTRDKRDYKRVLFDFNQKYKDKYKGKAYFIKTYGCQMNEHDSEKIRGMLLSAGFIPTEDITDADIIILNTCAIRENAHDKVFGYLGVLKHMKKSKKDLLVGICGCMAQEEVVTFTTTLVGLEEDGSIALGKTEDQDPTIDEEDRGEPDYVERTNSENTTKQHLPKIGS